jgi:hypothetical protein
VGAAVLLRMWHYKPSKSAMSIYRCLIHQALSQTEPCRYTINFSVSSACCIGWLACAQGVFWGTPVRRYKSAASKRATAEAEWQRQQQEVQEHYHLQLTDDAVEGIGSDVRAAAAGTPAGSAALPRFCLVLGNGRWCFAAVLRREPCMIAAAIIVMLAIMKFTLWLCPPN